MRQDQPALKLFLSARQLAIIAGIIIVSLGLFALMLIGLLTVPGLMLVAFILLLTAITYARRARS